MYAIAQTSLEGLKETKQPCPIQHPASPSPFAAVSFHWRRGGFSRGFQFSSLFSRQRTNSPTEPSQRILQLLTTLEQNMKRPQRDTYHPIAQSTFCPNGLLSRLSEERIPTRSSGGFGRLESALEGVVGGRSEEGFVYALECVTFLLRSIEAFGDADCTEATCSRRLPDASSTAVN